jgi:hypothetical protein
VTRAERTAIYDRAGVFFDQTVLLKPEESDRPEFEFAPLLVQEVTTTNQAPNLPYAVYFWRTRGYAGTRPLEQFNYVWFHSESRQGSKVPQGIRITFLPDGQPMLWEILRDPTGARILFVSQSLEAAAMTNHSTRLPGREFWVERSIEDAPSVVVARVLDEAPADMGPIVYLEAASYDVSTVICRCMDAQAKEVVGMGVYGLARLDDAAVRWLSKDKTPGITRWLPGKPPDDLGRWLRLDDF